MQESKKRLKYGVIPTRHRESPKRNECKKEIIKLEIKHRVKLGAKEILEKGEGYFFWFIER